MDGGQSRNNREKHFFFVVVMMMMGAGLVIFDLARIPNIFLTLFSFWLEFGL